MAALGFLSVLGRPGVPRRSTVAWFPAAGALIGLVVGGVWWGADQFWAPGVTAAIAVTADFAITGMLHLDGLADSADGLLPHLDRERRLAVMTQPTVGAFALGAVVAVGLLRWSALASMPANVVLIVALWIASRTVMAVAIGAVPYGRPGGGLATAFAGSTAWPPLAIAGGAAAVGLGAVAAGGQGVVAILSAFLAGATVVALGVRRLGGYTGDVLGAAGIVAETVGLVVAAARW